MVKIISSLCQKSGYKEAENVMFYRDNPTLIGLKPMAFGEKGIPDSPVLMIYP